MPRFVSPVRSFAVLLSLTWLASPPSAAAADPAQRRDRTAIPDAAAVRRVLVVPFESAAPTRAGAARHEAVSDALLAALRDDLGDERLAVTVADQPAAGASDSMTFGDVAWLGRENDVDYVLVGKYLVRGRVLRVEAHLVPSRGRASGAAGNVSVEGSVTGLAAVRTKLVEDVRWQVDVAAATPGDAEPARALSDLEEVDDEDDDRGRDYYNPHRFSAFRTARAGGAKASAGASVGISHGGKPVTDLADVGGYREEVGTVVIPKLGVLRNVRIKTDAAPSVGTSRNNRGGRAREPVRARVSARNPDEGIGGRPDNGTGVAGGNVVRGGDGNYIRGGDGNYIRYPFLHQMAPVAPHAITRGPVHVMTSCPGHSMKGGPGNAVGAGGGGGNTVRSGAGNSLGSGPGNTASSGPGNSVRGGPDRER